MACEVGLYYVLHITKQRNKNALLRLLPGLGECGAAAGPAPPPRGRLGHCEGFGFWRLSCRKPEELSLVLPDALCSRHRLGESFPQGWESHLSNPGGQGVQPLCSDVGEGP